VFIGWFEIRLGANYIFLGTLVGLFMMNYLFIYFLYCIDYNIATYSGLYKTLAVRAQRVS